MSYTPGPWTIQYSTNDYEGNLIYANRPIAATVTEEASEATSEDEANARLITAAPELLAALRQLMEWEGYDGGPPGNGHDEDTDRREQEVWQDAQDAIDKANGWEEER